MNSKFSNRSSNFNFLSVTLLSILLCLVVLGFGLSRVIPKVSAATWVGSSTGYFYGDSFDYNASPKGERVLEGGLNDNNDTSANFCSGTVTVNGITHTYSSQVPNVDSFVNFIEGNLDASVPNNATQAQIADVHQKNIAAAFIISNLLQNTIQGSPHPINDAKALVNDGSFSASYLKTEYSYSSCDNTSHYASLFNNWAGNKCPNTMYGQPWQFGSPSAAGGQGDVVSFNQSCSSLDNLSVVSFTHTDPDGTKYITLIKYECGNPVGQSTLLASRWKLDYKTTVDNKTLGSGARTTFHSSIQNDKSSLNAASYHWWVQGCYYTKSQGSSYCSGSNDSHYTNGECGKGGASPCGLPVSLPVSNSNPSADNVACSIGAYCPSDAQVGYTFPSSAGAGDGYCVRITSDNATGRDTADGSSSPACTTYAPVAPAETATCSINNINSDNVPGTPANANDVIAGSTFTYTVTVNNTGSVTTGNMSVSSSYAGGSVSPGSLSPSPSTITAGNHATTGNFSATAPNDTKSYILKATIGDGKINVTCPSITVNDYQTFANTINSALDDPEAPTTFKVNYTYKQSNIPATIPASLGSITSTITFERNGSTTPLFTGAVNPPPSESVPAKTPAEIGDAYCATVSPGGGYIGPSGIIITTPTASDGCKYVGNEPYAQFFGNDVIGDSAFDSSTTTCGNSGGSSGIDTSYKASSSANDELPQGSYTQFGAQARSIIEGLSSAGLRMSSPMGSVGLSFSNDSTGISRLGTDSADLGGNFGISLCAPTPDYTEYELPNAQPYVDGTTLSAVGKDYNSTGTTTIAGSSPISVTSGAKVAIFVKGNAYIAHNIVYEDSNSWDSISSIPSLWIIATGNIYIAPGVTQLDGVYIAQPINASSNNGGIIDTCNNSTGSWTTTELSGDGCNQQLMVNGAFIDQATLLDRTFSSVRFSFPGGETPQGGGLTKSCGAPGTDISSSYLATTKFSTCAAEVFNFSPEIYLSQPALKPVQGVYDYITSLSPTL